MSQYLTCQQDLHIDHLILTEQILSLAPQDTFPLAFLLFRWLCLLSFYYSLLIISLILNAGTYQGETFDSVYIYSHLLGDLLVTYLKLLSIHWQPPTQTSAVMPCSERFLPWHL